jgi:hypothetical protein
MNLKTINIIELVQSQKLKTQSDEIHDKIINNKNKSIIKF